jgi:plastocyanin
MPFCFEAAILSRMRSLVTSRSNWAKGPVKFDKEGEFNYHCKIHGKTMSGKVVVKPAA